MMTSNEVRRSNVQDSCECEVVLPTTTKTNAHRPSPNKIISLPAFNPDLSGSHETLTNHFVGLRKELSEAVIVACKVLRKDDPGIFVMFSGAEEIHAILGLPGSPIAPAANAALSVLALRGWIATLIPNPVVQLVSMPATSLDQGLSITNLSGQEFATILFTLTALMPWGAATMAAGRSAGSFHIIQGIGAGTCTIARGAVGAFVQSIVLYLSFYPERDKGGGRRCTKTPLNQPPNYYCSLFLNSQLT